ncbi:MAG TPA: addiction module antidote protein [Hyphomonadaceae bacterium]|nr:addiction module antidote protein [Hyphomonadaceae bacterium]
MAKVKTQPFDEAKYLETDEDIAVYLDEILQGGEPQLIAHALGVVARARGMTAIANEAGLTRESLYKALSADGNPEFATVLAVLRALKLRLSVAAAE